MNKKIATYMVTGGAGFIGSHLAEALLREGQKVVIVDDFNDFYDPSMKERNIEEIAESVQFEDQLRVERTDIRDRETLDRIFTRESFDFVVHLAARAGVRPSLEQPALYFDVNVNGTVTLLELCRTRHVPYFIFASSSTVYGNNRKVPFSEVDEIGSPISPYAASKRAAELICYTFYHLYGISSVILRFFTAYGARQRPDLAIRKFTGLLYSNTEIPFYGDGSTGRDYTYIDDIVQGIRASLSFIQKGDTPKYEIFNLGDSKVVRLRELVGLLEKKTGRKAKLKALPLPPGDMEVTCADIARARTHLGYEPRTTIDEGVDLFLKWYLRQKG
jgi:UDP-glucuronate 4-epimerase